MSNPRDVKVAEPEIATDTEVTTDTEYVVLSEEELEKPYRVILQNDDVTPMDIVVLVLNQVFGLDITRAVAVMMEAHYKGQALVAILPLEQAQERVYAAQSIARDAGYPLSFYLEPDE